MKKLLFLLIMFTSFAFLFAGPSSEGGASFVNIGSGGTAGTYFPLAGGMADIWNDNITDVNFNAQTTGASVANVNLLRSGEAQVVFVQNDVVYYAATGTELFAGNRYSDVRGMVTLYPETVQIITLAGSGIETVADLRGKRVGVGAAGSGTEANTRQILMAAGITYDDISVQYLSFAEASSNLKDGNVDAAFLTAGFPTAAVQDISATNDVQLVSITMDMVRQLQSEYSFYTPITIPSGTYSGINSATESVAVKAMLAVSSDLPNELVYSMLESMFANHSRLVAAHKKGEMITESAATEGMSIELHPGAAMYYNR